MKRPVVLLGFAIALAWSFSSALQGQELQEGTWSGSWINTRGDNPRPQSVSIEVKKIPDPHSRWRPGKGELLSITFVLPQGRAQVSDLRLEKGTLSYSSRVTTGDTINCRLDLRKDGTYEGDCVGEGGGNPRRHLTLTPPKDSR